MSGERGGALLLTLLASWVVFVVTVGALGVATDLAHTAARARTAADAAALAAAGTSPLLLGDGEPRAAARQVADANGTRLTRCCADDLRRWPFGAAVEVTAVPRTVLGRTVLPEVRIRAAAGVFSSAQPADGIHR